MLGYALAACASLADAMRLTLRYYQATTYLAVPTLQETKSQASIHLDPLHPVGGILPFIIEESFGGAVAILRSVMDNKLAPQELRLSYSPPEYHQQYEAYFRCPVLFNQSSNAILWDRDSLLKISPAYNPASADMAEALCKEMTADQTEEDGLVYQVRYILLQSPGKFPQTAEVAERLHISERTLRRGLSSAGLSFQQLLDEVRAKIATEYLQTTELGIEDIALLTGFSDATNFSRAFKKWTGESPSAARSA
jgi:AraC-like DNA-binding protein